MADYKLFEQIEDEMQGAVKYAKKAMHTKTTDRELADTYYAMAKQELNHAETLHMQAQRILKKHPEEHGMQYVYDWIHDKMVGWKKDLRALMEEYERA